MVREEDCNIRGYRLKLGVFQAVPHGFPSMIFSHELQEDRSPVSSFMCLMTGLPLLEANDDLASLRLALTQLQGSCAL